MPLVLNDLKLYGSATMPDDDSVTNIGGAIATAKKVDFTDNTGGFFQIVSSSSADTTQTVTVVGRDTTGAQVTDTKTLSGTSPVALTPNYERLLKSTKSATTGGFAAVEAQIAERTGTAQAGAQHTITLDAGASGVNGFYNAMVIRLTGGTGVNQIREIIDYIGSTKVATVNYPWATIPDATTTFRVARGIVFDRLPNETTEVRRPFFNASANAPGGGAVQYYDKVFFQNSSSGFSLLNAQVQLTADPTGKIRFGLEAVVNGTSTNGVGNNRKVAPSGVTFGTSPVNVPGTDLLAGSSIGVWLKLDLLDGDAAQKSAFTLSLTGSTV